MPTVYVNKLLGQILKPALVALPDDPKPTHVTKQPADVADHLPIIVCKSPAGTELDPRFGADFAAVQCDVYAAGEDEAQKWSAWVRDQLFEAYDKQTVFAAGYLSSFSTEQRPSELPDTSMPSDIVRYLAEYRLGVRPP